MSLGVAMGLSPTVKDCVYPSFKAFAQVPVLGWLPLLMLLVGIDEALKIIEAAHAKGKAVSVGVLGNAAEVFPDMVRRGIRPDERFG